MSLNAINANVSLTSRLATLVKFHDAVDDSGSQFRSRISMKKKMKVIAAHDRDPLLSVLCKTTSRNLKMRMASSFFNPSLQLRQSNHSRFLLQPAD